MNPIIILFVLSAMFLVFAIWSWRMPEKRWLNWLKADRNMLGIDYSKYNPQKIRSASTTLLFFEAVCLDWPLGNILFWPRLFVWELWEHLLFIGLWSWCSARRVNTGRNSGLFTLWMCSEGVLAKNKAERARGKVMVSRSIVCSCFSHMDAIIPLDCY